MNEIKIHNGDVITFTALKWKEENWRTDSPAILVSPVTHFYEDGIDLDSVISEALIDITLDGRLRDMRAERFLFERGWNLKYLKHLVNLIKKGRVFSDKNYSILKETYRFWRDGHGRFQYVSLDKSSWH